MRERAADLGADRFTLLVAASALVASRSTGLSELSFGTLRTMAAGDPSAVGTGVANIQVRAAKEIPAAQYIADLQLTVAKLADAKVVEFAPPAPTGPPAFRVMLVPAPGSSVLISEDITHDRRTLRTAAAGCDLVVQLVETASSAGLSAEYDAELFEQSSIDGLLGQIEEAAWQLANNPPTPIGVLAVVTQEQRNFLVGDLNNTALTYDKSVCVHELFEAQVVKTPHSVAVTFADESLTYSELNERANRLAHLLISKGVAADGRVGICLDRSLTMVVAVLAVLKAGGAYIPMDPAYPASRVRYMVEDSSVRLVLGDGPTAEKAARGGEVIRLDQAPERGQPSTDPGHRTDPSALAYVMYTSGSTGNPKGVMVEHGNVVNFFAGMDQRLGTDAGVWLAVTSLSFDISVLELLWTLTHGYQVILFSTQLAQGQISTTARNATRNGATDFGLFYFGSDNGESGASGREKYRLLLEGARFADQNGFSAVWTPERHFHTFGGMFPSPAVAAGALAVATERVSIRAGSVVLPLNNPVRVAEEWALVDNLSDGRVEISFASGWQPQDFALAPDAYHDRSERMFTGIETVKALWRGEERVLPGGNGEPVTVVTRPRPVQAELPVWVTAGGSPETFRRAGAIGANVLTHLLGQSIEELAERISVYRASWLEHGHPADEGRVALMLHTFVSNDMATVRAQAHDPLKGYLKGAVGLFAPVAAAQGLDVDNLSEADLDALAEHAFERYFESSGLFGTPDSCAPMIERLRACGVDEIACLIDFGIPTEVVLASLPRLNELRRRFASQTSAVDYSIEALIRRHAVTHLQCTPSMASMLVGDAASAAALSGLHHLLVGGEALTEQLAERLLRAVPEGRVTNMYGPTETTVWSTTHTLSLADSGPVSIGTPIANTQIYILDDAQNLLPGGAVGDLWIGGDGVARGYLGQDDLTAERFVADPFSDPLSQPGARIYRTGDLARWRPDGTLEFLGRADTQVKLRGYRIELGEIEATLRRHPTVAEAAVLVREDTPDDKRLIAYVVAQPGATVVVDDLATHLRASLADYMIPSAFVTMTVFPLTPNGKTDRNALPAASPSLDRKATTPPVQRSSHVSDSVAALIAEIWCDVLKVPTVGMEDNFFDLGGHSMLIVHVLNQLREKLGSPPARDLSMTDLFRFPTVHGLASFLRGAPAANGVHGQAQDRAAQRRQLRGSRSIADAGRQEVR